MEVKAIGISKEIARKNAPNAPFLAVAPVDFTLRPGQVITVMGKSGSGKSTLLNMLAGLLSPSKGQVFQDEIDLYELSDEERSKYRNQHIGLISQGQTPIGTLTVLENVLLPGLLFPSSNPERKPEVIRDRALSLLEELGIANLQNAYPKELSGGECRRMAIARALIMNPEVIYADEPTADLDDENTEKVLKLFRQSADRGACVLLVTHDEEALPYSDIVYSMKGGVLESLKPAQVVNL